MNAARLRLFALCALCVAALGVRSALAMLGRPTDWPVERLLANVARYVERHPEVAEGHYCLGRIHVYAFGHDLARLATEGRDGETLAEDLESGRKTIDDLAQLVLAEQGWVQSPKLAPGVLIEHLGEGLSSLGRALALAPERGAFHLTLAYALERGAHLADQIDSTRALGLEPIDPASASDSFYSDLIRKLGDPAKAESARATLTEPTKLKHALPWLDRERASPDRLRQEHVATLLARAWLDLAIGHYRSAFELAYETDRTSELVYDYWGLTSLEAAEAYLRLTDARPELAPDAAFRARVGTALEELRRIPLLGSTTPILLSLEGCRSLEELVSPEHTVLFDLDGDLVVEAWPWPAPSAGWLVWDPKREGRIESGRDLFGSASSWFFFPDGYRVLDALDNDRSGALRGPELAGIAVWFDRDSDGVSDRGEVVPVEELGIAALATEATLRFGASPANLCGLELADGRVLPTYDWVLAPVRP